MWNSNQYVFEQFIIRGRGFDPHIFEIQEVIPPSYGHDFWEINFKDGGKMITTETVSIQLRDRKSAVEMEEKGIRSIRIG